MIKEYKNGLDFLKDNLDLVSSNLHYEVFFRSNAENLRRISKQEFAISVFENGKSLCVTRKLPFNAIYIGDKDLAPTLADYLIDHNIAITDFSAPKEVGIRLMNQFNKRNVNCSLKICMNYMKCKSTSFQKDNRVIKAKIEDLDEIYNLMNIFCDEVKVTNCETKEMIAKEILKYRIIRNEKEIMAMAKICDSSDKDNRISDVYTRPQYRGKKLASSLVSSCVCEINENGRFATLAVDADNPISNHVYHKIGFRKTFESGFFEIK